MTNYSQKYFGNQYQSGQMVSKAKGLSKGEGKVLSGLEEELCL